MKRVSWKLPYISTSLLKRGLRKDKYNNAKALWVRNSVIPPFMLGRRTRIYNGAWFLTQTVNAEMIGSKFGEYSITKRFDVQKKSSKKNKKIRKN